MVYQSGHTNITGVGKTSLPLISETSGTEIIIMGVSQPFRRTGVSLNNTTINPPITHSNQSASTVDRRLHSYCNVSLNSLESSYEVLRVEIGYSGNDGIRMNPPGTIGGNFPQVLYFAKSIVSWHGAAIIENPGCDILFLNACHEKN